MEQFCHSVTLVKENCKGCTHCVKRCPTEAIRVRDGKARIISERCIDCGQCIRVCPHHAKKAVSDPLCSMDKYSYKIALPAPALYGQFNNLEDTDILLSALEDMGFDMIYEVARAAELVSSATRHFMKENHEFRRPIISSACPAVLRLIRVRFPSLLPNVLPLHPPVEMAARLAKSIAQKETGLPMEQIGTMFISPCPAKVTALKMPLGAQSSAVDCVVAISEIYPVLLGHLKELAQVDDLTRSGRSGARWSISGGEAAATLNQQHLAADGIENVIKVLEDLEDEKFQNLDFVELNACSAGCVGGVLAVENPYIAQAKIKHITSYRPVSCNHVEPGIPQPYCWEEAVEYQPVLQLDSNLQKSMQMMAEMERIEEGLYGLDCGSCGAPTCRALAEDIVRGFATEEACIFLVRDQLQSIAEEVGKISNLMPSVGKREKNEREE